MAGLDTEQQSVHSDKDELDRSITTVQRGMNLADAVLVTFSGFKLCCLFSSSLASARMKSNAAVKGYDGRK